MATKKAAGPTRDKGTHSPGPWKVGKLLKNLCIVDASGVMVVAQVTTRWTTTNAEEWKRNADLLAAAPELLENLRELVAFYDAHGGPMAKSRALLARIDGEQA